MPLLRTRVKAETSETRVLEGFEAFALGALAKADKDFTPPIRSSCGSKRVRSCAAKMLRCTAALHLNPHNTRTEVAAAGMLRVTAMWMPFSIYSAAVGGGGEGMSGWMTVTPQSHTG